MRDFREIKVWAKAHLLTLEIYKVTATFPREEKRCRSCVKQHNQTRVGSEQSSARCRKVFTCYWYVESKNSHRY